MDSTFECYCYIECYDHILIHNYQQAIETGKQAINECLKDIYENLCLGEAHFKTGQSDLALEHFKKAEMNATNKKWLVAIYNLLGSAYHLKGDLENALLYFSKSLRFAEELGDKSSELAQLNNIALIFLKEGELDKALDYLDKSLELATNENDKASRYNNIGVIYSDKGEYVKAVDYFKKAIESYTQCDSYVGSAQAMLNLGNTYRKMKDFNNAYFYLQEGLKMVQKAEDKFWEAVGYGNLGWYFKDQGNKKLAKDYLSKAYEIFKSIGARAEARMVLIDLSEVEQLQA